MGKGGHEFEREQGGACGKACGKEEKQEKNAEIIILKIKYVLF